MHGMKWLRSTLSTSVFCLFLLLLGLAPRRLTLVNAQGAGFISIDCGASEERIYGNISWTPDGNYTLTGNNAKAGNGADPPFDTLRYFPDERFNKSCYVFNTTVSMSYLIRAGFYYGNYDNKSTLPNFVLLFGANLWTNVTFKDANETVTHEMIALATSNTASVCVGRSTTTNHIPFISSLEVRPLSSNQKMYSPVHGNFLMMLNSRHNFGQTTNDSVRYPDDAFDRIWDSDMKAITDITTYNTTMTTNVSVSAAVTNNLPPSKVMQTARSPNKTDNMTFSFSAKFGPGQYYLAFYFADFVNSTQRIMDLYIDGILIKEALNVFALRGLYNTLELYNSYTVTHSNYRLFLIPNKNSTRAPIINAAESYFLQTTTQSTFEQDVQALEAIKFAFNLSASMGDPCLPSVYKWTWLDCDNNGSPARVIALNLSSMDLHSEIPPAVANLSALTSVDFHNNSLFGSIPSSLARLTNLTFLDLNNNNLSGDVPIELRNSTKYRFTTGNPLLCIEGGCDAPAPAPRPATAPSVRSRSNSIRLMSLMIGVLLAVTIVVVGVVLGFILHKRKYRKRKTLFGVHSAHWPPVPPFTEISKAVDPGVAVQKGDSNDVPIYSFDDVKVLTNNFENKINAAGGFGTLFYGTLSDGQEVVVKLLQSNIEQTPIEFLYKVTPLSYVNHKNLLRPIGFCAESHRFMFVYEHVQKGSLYDYLHNKHMLDWKSRLSILQQVAQGLEHLHNACTPSIIHGNLKSTNVLLSGDGLLAKVSDFGIYGLSPNVDATSGYLDPEYFSMQKLTGKSDVYSFGVLILEVVCGRVPFDTSLPKDAWNIVDWARQASGKGDHELIADACLHGNYNTSTLSTVIQLALKATESNISERPAMADLVVELKEANKMEVGHHVVFAEQDMSDLSDSSEAPLPSAYEGSLFEDDTPQHMKS